MKRKLIKGVLTFTLLLAMLVTMAKPVSIYAEELATDDEHIIGGIHICSTSISRNPCLYFHGDTADDNQDFDDEQTEASDTTETNQDLDEEKVTQESEEAIETE